MPRRLSRRLSCVLAASVIALMTWGGGLALADDEEPPKKAPAKEAPAKEAPPTEAPKAPRSAADLRKDIEELVRRSGKLPEGFRPHGMGPSNRPPFGATPPGAVPPGANPPGTMRSGGMGGPAAQTAMTKALGTLLLKYLDEKDDPVKAAVYEALLRDLGTALANGEGANLEQVGARMLGRIMGGMQDPKQAPVYREILQLFGEALTAAVRMPARPPVAPAPPAPPAASGGPAIRWPSSEPLRTNEWPRTFGGAEVVYVRAEGPPPTLTAMLRRIPADSPAHAAGLKAGDTLLKVDGKPASPAALRKADGAFVPGGKLRLRLLRMNGTTEVLDLEFEAAEAEMPAKAGK